MSIQWTLAAGFLYMEIAMVALLLIPVISPTKWKQIFNSRFIRKFHEKSHLFFNFIIVILAIFLFDAVREMIKYSQTASTAINASMKAKVTEYSSVDAVKEFRSQRNLYITGMSLFLWFVIKRLVILITTTANMMENINLLSVETTKLRDDYTRVLEAKVRLELEKQPSENLEKNIPSEKEPSDKEELRSRSRSRVKKEL